MNLEKHRGLSLIIYLLSNVFYIIGIFIIYKFLFNLHYYYKYLTLYCQVTIVK